MFQVINDTSIRATLHLSKAAPRRFMAYTCMAKNVVGQSKGHIELLKGIIDSSKMYVKHVSVNLVNLDKNSP